MSDQIRLVGLSFYGFHGAIAAEQETGRMYEVDCEMDADLSRACQSDRLSDTIDYAAVYMSIREIVEGTQYKLLEALAERIARILLDKFPITRVTLHVRKLTPPIAGHVKFVEVAITRSREYAG